MEYLRLSNLMNQKETGYCIQFNKKNVGPGMPYIPPHRRMRTLVNESDCFSRKKETDQTSIVSSINEYVSVSESEAEVSHSNYSTRTHLLSPMMKHRIARALHDHKLKPQDKAYSNAKEDNFDNNNNMEDFSSIVKHRVSKSVNGCTSNSENRVHDDKKEVDVVSQTDCSNNLSSMMKHRITKLANVYANTDFKKDLKEIYKQEFDENLLEDAKNLKFVVTVEDVSTTSKSNVPFSDKPPNYLKLEDLNREFWINIFWCDSVTNIWGVELDDADYSENLQNLSDEMEAFYKNEKSKLTIVKKDSYYAVYDGSWHRVKCLKYMYDIVTVFFIDRGDQDVFAMSKLHVLDPKFFSIPAQAIKLSLSGLEIFSDLDNFNSLLKETILNKVVFARSVKVDSRNERCLSVKLYVANEEETINVNNLLVDKVIQKCFDPKVFIKIDMPIKCQITHLSRKGVFIQLHTKSFEFFNSLMKEGVKKVMCDNNYEKYMVIRFDKDSVYFVLNKENKQWYRAKLIQFINEREILVFLLDIGTVLVVSRENCLLLEKLCYALAKYPKQAIRLKFDELSMSPTLLNNLQDMDFEIEMLYVKYKTTLDGNIVPSLYLPKRNINDDSIVIDDNLLSKIKDNCSPKHKTDKTSPIKKVTNVNSSPIKEDSLLFKLKETVRQNRCFVNKMLRPISIPKDNYFKVHVALAYDPSHFVVQLVSNKNNELQDLNKSMSEVYNFIQSPKLTYEIVQIGQVYAVQGDVNDEQWYRVYVIKKVNMTTAFVYYCDYGHYKNINMENLVILHAPFYELPCQAIWCELYGVKPVHENWSVENNLRFQNLIQSKNFFCSVKNKKEFKFKSMKDSEVIPIILETIYVVELIDMSLGNHMFIKDILINDNQALKYSNRK